MTSTLREIAASIPLLPGEAWWGGACQDGCLMPFGGIPYRRDLRCDLGGNQAAPLLLSNMGRYIWSDEAFEFEFADGGLLFQAESYRIEQGFGGLAGAYHAACNRHFPPTGLMPDPTAFAAPQFNTWVEMGREPTQDGVISYADAILQSGIPPGVLIFDEGWSEDFGDWRFHSGRFPDPAGMMRALKAMGFTAMLWLVPFVSPDSGAFRELEASDLLLRREDGDVAVRRWWNGFSAVLDVTNPFAVSWLRARMDLLVEQFGVTGFKMDGGDPDVFRYSDRGYSPIDPARCCEDWGRLALPYPLAEYRACWKLGGNGAIQRLRDKHSRWGRDGLADLIPNALAQGLLGHAFVCPDMVGGGDISTADRTHVDQELFVRATQCSALFPMIQFSIAPWRALDAEHFEHCMDAVRLRQQLVPEILMLARHASRTGEPIMRHMEYVFAGGGFSNVVDQFMLGDDILVAPVLERGARSRRVCFPPGDWQSACGPRISGPVSLVVDAPLGRLPWFRRVP